MHHKTALRKVFDLRLLHLGFALLCLTAAGCNNGNSLNLQTYHLKSGKQIKVKNLTTINFPKSGPAMVMDYETEIPVTDKPALRSEINEIWETFRVDVEKADLNAGVIRAVNDRSGLVKVEVGYGFVFIKRPDGTWYCVDDEKK